MSTREIAYGIIDRLSDEQIEAFIELFGALSETPNAETQAAMLEADRIARDPSVKAYDSVDEMFREILDDEV